jgi:hypothetical protein
MKNVSPSEAEEALAAVQVVMQKTRHSIADSGAYVTLIATGIVWLVGFMGTQFLSGPLVAYVWIGASVLGSILGIFMGIRMSKRVRSPSAGAAARRVGLFWLLLILYGTAAIAVAWPLDGKQLTALILLFAMVGHLAMGLLLGFASVWWPLPITALVLVAYFLLPNTFYLWMSLLGGGGMIALGIYIRSRW